MSDQDFDDQLPADPMVNVANGMVIITGLILMLALFIMWQISADLYDAGMMGG